MDSIALYSGAVFYLPSRFSSNKQIKLGKPLFSIRDSDSVDSRVPISNSDSRDKAPSQKVADGRKDEILALLRRIRSSIAKVEAANLQNGNPILSNEPSNQLKEGVVKKEGKVVKRKQPVAKKDQKLQNNGLSPGLAFKATRLPSSFSKRSPVPSSTDPRGKNPPGGNKEASTISSNIDLKDQKLLIDGQSSELDFKASRLPSSFLKRSPIPCLTNPTGNNRFGEKDETSAFDRNDDMKDQKLVTDEQSSELDFRASRLPSSFMKRSPIPSLTKPKGNNPFGAKDGTSAFGSNNNLKEMKVAELKKLAKTRGIKGYSKLKKSELLELLSL